MVDSGSGSTVLRTLLLYARALRYTARVPYPLLIATVFPLLLFWLLCQIFGALPRSLHNFPTSDYLAYLAPAMAVASVLPCSLWCGAALHRDRQSGMLDHLLASPIGRATLVTSTLLTAVTCGALASLLIILASLLSGLQSSSGPTGLLAVVLLALVLSILYAAVAWALATLVRDSTLLVVTGSAILVCSLALSNLILPNALLPGWLRALAVLNPLTYAMEGARALVWAHADWQTYDHDLVVLAILAVLGAAAALLIFRWRIEYRS